MVPGEAVALLERMGERTESISSSLDQPIRNWVGMLLSDLGTEEEQVVSGTLGELSEIGIGYVHAFILPAEFSGMEESAFERRRLPN
jgi:diphthamide biosynthesis methyltransferase